MSQNIIYNNAIYYIYVRCMFRSTSIGIDYDNKITTDFNFQAMTLESRSEI